MIPSIIKKALKPASFRTCTHSKNMVEAAGIEPASENVHLETCYKLFSHLNSHRIACEGALRSYPVLIFPYVQTGQDFR